MGFFDWLSSGEDTSYGYKTFKNKPGWDNAKMLELLREVETDYGTPKMGWIRAFGKEREVIVYNRAATVNYVYVDAQPKKIIVSMAPKPGQVGGSKEHYDRDDSEIEDPNIIKSTRDAMEPVDEIIKVVKALLDKA
ncbi:MAG: hypothetical protein IK020_05960 [Clostridiales bacterium]|nr:hypothetical protein [Clostridiales bacterium]MBR5974711.1 hypothetical protein [Clostridiales bacterium]